MTQNSSAPSPDQLTVLIFKDSFTARTFRIPMKWIRQFGWVLCALVLTVVLSLGFAFKAALSSRVIPLTVGSQKTAPIDDTRILELEAQLKDARGQIQSLSSKGASDPLASDTAPPSDGVVSASSTIAGKPFLFRGLSEQIQAPPSDPAELKIKLAAPRAKWEGKTLQVRFALQYVSDQPGGQQGHFLVIARGPGALLTHPNQIFKSSGNETLIDHSRGEYFSVSRYREAKATFGPLPSREWIKEVEVIVLSSSGQILIHQRIIPGEAPKND